jgi:hypothetical protein
MQLFLQAAHVRLLLDHCLLHNPKSQTPNARLVFVQSACLLPGFNLATQPSVKDIVSPQRS